MCLKETWIEQLPKTLMFNLKRVNYDYKVRGLVKNNKRFDFEKVIYADKFLKEKKNKDEELSQQINRYREKQSQIREKLDQFKEFHKGISIKEILEVTKTFIENQTEDFEEIDHDGEMKPKGNQAK